MAESRDWFSVTNELIEKSSSGNKGLLENLKLVGIDCDEIPNSAITLNNKMVEIIGGLDRKASGIEGIVISKLVEEYIQIEEELKKINDILEKKYNQSTEKSLKKPNFISKIIDKIRSGFAAPKELSDEEKKNIYNILNRIKEKDKYILNYDLKENIVDDIQRDFDLEGYGEGLRENFVQGMKYELNNNGLKEQAEELEKKERKRKEKNKFKDKLIVNEIPEKISNKKENKSNRSEIRKESDERI